MEYKVYCMAGDNCDQYIILDDYEYGFYDNDYICGDCQNAEDMDLHDWYDDGDDSYALASAGFGSDEDYM